MAIIIGIDPGSRVTGYGIINWSGSVKEYIDSGCIRIQGDILSERLQQIYKGVTELITAYSPQYMAIEKVFMARNPDSALKLGHARGVAMVAGANQSLSVFEYSARQIKQAVVGKGSAEKSQVQHMVTALLNLNKMPQADAADALAVALCHLHTEQSLIRIAGASSHRNRRLQHK